MGRCRVRVVGRSAHRNRAAVYQRHLMGSGLSDIIHRRDYSDRYFPPGESHWLRRCRPAPLRYHYFWFILCSLVNQAGGTWVPARNAFFAGTIWCGIGLACAIAAFLRFFPSGLVRSGQDDLHPGGFSRASCSWRSLGSISCRPSLCCTFASSTIWIWKRGMMRGHVVARFTPVGSARGRRIGGGCNAGFLVLFHAVSQDRPARRWMGAAVAGITVGDDAGRFDLRRLCDGSVPSGMDRNHVFSRAGETTLLFCCSQESSRSSWRFLTW